MPEQITLTKEQIKRFWKTCNSPAPRNAAIEKAKRRRCYERV